MSENMQKYAVLYAKYAEVYILHILHLNALPIWLMETFTSLLGTANLNFYEIQNHFQADFKPSDSIVI